MVSIIIRKNRVTAQYNKLIAASELAAVSHLNFTTANKSFVSIISVYRYVSAIVLTRVHADTDGCDEQFRLSEDPVQFPVVLGMWQLWDLLFSRFLSCRKLQLPIA